MRGGGGSLEPVDSLGGSLEPADSLGSRSARWSSFGAGSCVGSDQRADAVRHPRGTIRGHRGRPASIIKIQNTI